MGKIIKNTTEGTDLSSEKVEDKKNKSEKSLSKITDKLLFEPSSPMAKIKAKFWTRFQPGPLFDPTNLTMAQVLEVTNSPKIRKWWSEPGFVSWFMNKEEEREQLKYLFSKALNTAEDILDNPNSNDNAKVNIIKMLAEIEGYLGKKQVEKFADDTINKMSEQQLMNFLEQKGVKVTKETIVDVRKDQDKISDDKG